MIGQHIGKSMILSKPPSHTTGVGQDMRVWPAGCGVIMYYNFGRIHKSLRVTPAMEAGVSDHVWSLEKIAKLADQAGC